MEKPIYVVAMIDAIDCIVFDYGINCTVKKPYNIENRCALNFVVSELNSKNI